MDKNVKILGKDESCESSEKVTDAKEGLLITLTAEEKCEMMTKKLIHDLKDKKLMAKDIKREKMKYERFKALRPLPDGYELDKFDMPVIKRVKREDIDIEIAGCIGIQSLSRYNNTDKIALSFRCDRDLARYWNDPRGYITRLKSAMAVCTPDYSVYPCMNKNTLTHNIFKNRWLGCYWQSYGVVTLPTISWATRDTYDICFSGVESGGIVVISTLGCTSYGDMFIDGFNEMKRRLQPELVVVYGNMIEGMHGTFINYKYEDALKKGKRGIEYELFSDSNTNVFEW